ncbi:hypothetical protein SAMN02745117_01032 [Lampropedia hyalina DSM 16112]|uniref:DUF3352 domain-containing protein n=2 Tax=Lampropedia TaxID=198705 RepID=A0A1M4XDJ6_9BURK|nr:hypothetical protein SAMN02745117_01032 [Lampropedia hyalina DSM 16112]
MYDARHSCALCSHARTFCCCSLTQYGFGNTCRSSPYPISTFSKESSMQIQKLTCVAALALLAAACSSKKEASADALNPLSYAPADTAYVIGNLEAAPADYQEIYNKLVNPLSQGVLQSLARAIEKTSEIKDPEQAAKAKSLLEFLQAQWQGGLENIGVDIKGRGAIYEINSLPVLRMELTDPGKFKAFIANLETHLGKPFATGTVQNQPYWQIPLEQASADNDAQIVLALIGKQAVLSVHTRLANTSVEQLLGLQKPEKSILDTGELQAINKEYGFKPYGTILLKPQTIAQKFLGQTGQETWVSQQAAARGKNVSEVCRSEITALIGKVPRIVGGYTELNKKQFDMRYTLELEPALAQSLTELTAPVPGLGKSGNTSAVEIGMGLHLNKLAAFVQTQASAIQAAPFECEVLQSWNEAAGQAQQQLAGLYMVAGWVNGFRANLTELNLQTPSAKGTVLLTSPNPSGLLGMAQGFVPQLAQLNLAPNAEPQQLDASFLAMLGMNPEESLWVATSETALGVSLGQQDGKAALQQDLKAAPATPAPFLYTRFTGDIYADLMRTSNENIPAEMQQEDVATYITWPLMQSLPTLYEQIGNMSSLYLFTSKGIEVRQETTLK